MGKNGLMLTLQLGLTSMHKKLQDLRLGVLHTKYTYTSVTYIHTYNIYIYIYICICIYTYYIYIYIYKCIMFLAPYHTFHH